MTTIDDLAQLTNRTLGGLKVESVVERPPHINALFYGGPGVGKTVLAGSASEVAAMAPVLFLDLEGGTFSLRKRHPNVELVRVTNFKQLQKIYDELFAMKHGFKTVVLDSLSEMQKASMETVMKELMLKEPDRDPDIPGIREWGKNGEQIRRLVRAFRDLPMHTIFTALAAEDKDQRTGMRLTQPALPGKMRGEVGGFVDILGLLYIKQVDDENIRLLLTQKTEKAEAKDRTDSLPAVLQNPTMTVLHSHIFNTES